MNLRFFAYRLAAALTAFALGVGIFNAGQYLQSFFQTTETATTVERETLSVPARPAPTVVFEISEPRGYGYAVVEAPAATEEKEPAFNPDGDYYIVGILPKGFKDFNDLSVTTRDYENASEENNYEGAPIPPEGFIYAGKKFEFKRININGKQISFETETIKGISYKFVGEFIVDVEEVIKYRDANGNKIAESAMLKGRLTKMRDGKKTAEIKAHFAAGGC